MRYFIEFSYFGKHYFGYQIQPKEISVQEVLENALSTLLREKIKTTGAGRTDTGVHAKKIYAHFDTEIVFPNNFVNRLNSFLPKDIAVKNVFEVGPNSHARFDALYRTYEYHISLEKNPFATEQSWIVSNRKLDVDKMNEACKILFEFSDFSSFAKIGSDNKTNICKIFKANWEIRDNMLILTISADRFLRNMVRSIVGTMVEVGNGKVTVMKFREIIEQKNRSAAGTSAPAQGLFLVDVGYSFIPAII